MEHIKKYTSMAQRAASSYLRALAEGGETEPEQRDLRGFFQAFYTALYEHPEQFGLPLVADDSFVEGEPGGTAHKAELNKKLKKPHDLIAAGLDFLMAAGCNGHIEGTTLVAGAEIAERVKKNRGLRTFLQGVETAGLQVVTVGDTLRLDHSRFTAMMPALQTLARACAVYPDVKAGAFHFARCDFGALQPGFMPNPLDLYKTFPPAEFARVAELHEYFIAKKYQPILTISGVSTWMVQYQGRRQVKATPLFQVEYQERYRNPVVLFLKPASTARIAPLIPHQSQILQDDFFRRVNYCRGSECDWCKNNKNLGPTAMKRNGQPVVVCWYTNPTVVADENTVALVEEYAEMHENLVK
jgi:hypothetical protein